MSTSINNVVTNFQFVRLYAFKRGIVLDKKVINLTELDLIMNFWAFSKKKEKFKKKLSSLAPLSTYNTNAEVLYEFLIEYRFYSAHSHDNGITGDFRIEFWLKIDGSEYKVESSQFDNHWIGKLIPERGFLIADTAYLDSTDEYCTNVYEVDWLNPDDRVIPNQNLLQDRYCFLPYAQFSTASEGSIAFLLYYENPSTENGGWLEIRITILDITGTGGGSPVPIE